MANHLEHKPKYQELKHTLLQDVILQLQPAAQIPTERALMYQYELSYSTVSRALQELEDEGYICRIQGKGTFRSESDSQEVHAVSSLDRLKRITKSTLDIGIAFFSIADRTAYITEIIKGVEAACHEKRGHVHVYATGGKSIVRGKDSLLKNLILSRHIDGLILVSPFDERDIYTMYRQEIPFVVLGYHYRNLRHIPRVAIDHCAGMESAAQYLVSKGYKELGAIIGPLCRRDSIIQVETNVLHDVLQKLSREYGLRLEQKHLKTGSYFEGKRMIEEILNASSRPAAVITDGDIIYEDILRVLHSRNINPQTDMLILNYADNPDRAGRPAICKPLFQAGKAAVELLFRMIAGDLEETCREVWLKPSLVI